MQHSGPPAPTARQQQVSIWAKDRPQGSSEEQGTIWRGGGMESICTQRTYTVHVTELRPECFLPPWPPTGLPGILPLSSDAPGDGCHLSFPGRHGGLGDMAVPPRPPYGGCLRGGSLHICCSQALVSRGTPPSKSPGRTVPRTLPSEPWFPHVPPKVATADTDGGGGGLPWWIHLLTRAGLGWASSLCFWPQQVRA